MQDKVRSMTDHSTARALVERLRRMAKCIHIAVEATVADDISDGLTEAADFIEQSLTPPEGDTVSEGVVEACKRVFLAGHSEGWTGNQTRRDVQHVDAEKGWSLYVKNGALKKAITALQSRTAKRRHHETDSQ